MNLLDTALLTFSCVAANHLGLITAAENVLKRNLPIVNCPKCFTFWCVLFTTVLSGWNMIGALAVSFFFAYLAIWLELLMGFFAVLYDKYYEKIYTKTASGHTIATDADKDYADGDVSDLQEK